MKFLKSEIHTMTKGKLKGSKIDYQYFEFAKKKPRKEKKKK